MNSKIEESSEPCRPTLLNMPKVVMEEVLKNLDCPSIFCLRKVCRDLRFSIDEINPELHFNSAALELLPPITSSMVSDYKDMRADFFKFNVELYVSGTGYRLDLDWSLFRSYKYPQISMEDAKTLLKYPKLIIDNLTIGLLIPIEIPSEYIEKKEEDLKKFNELLEALVEKRSKFLKAKKVRCDVRHLSQAATILKCTDPQSLKTIAINCWPGEKIEMDFSKSESLEQWKNAEELKINGNFDLKSVDSFGTFETISIHCEEISMEKLNEVKECFVRSPKLQTFLIESHDVLTMKDQILSNFGQFDSYNEEFDLEFDDEMYEIEVEYSIGGNWTWLMGIPGSIEKLQITLNTGFDYIKLSKV